jgi:hypothetical protein
MHFAPNSRPVSRVAVLALLACAAGVLVWIGWPDPPEDGLDVAGGQSAPEGPYLARARHVEALQAVAAHLQEAELQLAAQAAHLDLLAEELRLAQVSLNSITGEFSSDDLLGVIFSSFCIGK